MMKIAYIELDTHAEIAKNFFQLFEDSERIKIDFFLSEKIYKILNIRADNVMMSEPSIVLDQLVKSNYDLVIIGTAHRYFNTFIAIAKQYKTVIIAHNLNFIKASKTTLFHSIFKKDCTYRLKLFIKESLLSAPFLYKNNTLLVLDENLQNLQNQYLGIFFQQYHSNPRSGDVINIVVPGTVSQQRRNYRHILTKLKESTIKDNIHLVFLGKLSADVASEIVKAKLPANILIETFSEKISQTIFDNYMQKADVLWCPIKGETRFFSGREYYGITKMTGNVGDAITYGKLAIFPKDYQNHLASIIQEEDDVLNQIKKLKKQLTPIDSSFSKKEVLKKAEILLLSLI